ncbi:pyridoxamine 5'-phosphate oxidase family protein [Luteipulveratus mongoliensis]|uniref:Pyridoxamine 5'-phosphate oxidase n=1 Tax=Luteipulveratus mongoliensis TaxID=571913 RepID=A0A0K1JNT0_9MICO|nr:pyridoxamine 5'-phosphate oxidase family protein [Luteipulveratus mongoliensis]AKU18371.1 pyridoxamine 5'-phosphate oxidase [Luteipulveratus mongoliensis]
MKETAEEIAGLQDLLDRSHTSSTGHLKNIINDERVLTAQDIVALMTGMKVLSVATVTASGEPRISAMDGHFLHGTWSFGTSAGSAKGRHMAARPTVSVAHVDGEEVALFSHGRAEELLSSDEDFEETLAHWTAHYGSSPLSWGDDVRLYRYQPTWMVGYAMDREALLRGRGISA